MKEFEKLSNKEFVFACLDELKNIDSIKTRLFGSKFYVDIEIAVLGSLTVTKSHDIAERIHDNIEANIKNCKHCMVHINPYNVK